MRTRRQKRHKVRRTKVRRNKTHRYRHRKHRGGGTLPIPRGAIASMSLDPKDEYGVPVLVRRELAEEEILDE